MTLPNGFKKDLAACLGDRRVADIVYDSLNDAGADGSGTFTTVVATTSVSSPVLTSVTTVNTSGDVACFTLDGNGIVMQANQDITINGGDLLLIGGADLTFTGTTGQNHIFITDNLAASLDVKISGGNTFLLFDTTDSDEKVTVGPASSKLAFRGATPQASVTYTITNDVTDRTFDANANSTLELADVVATLLKDLAAMGLLTTA